MLHPQRARGPLLSEAALLVLGAVAVLGLRRLFVDLSFAGPILGALVASQAVAALCRRMRWSLGRAAALSLVGLALFVAWAVEPHTTRYGLPTLATWRATAHDLSGAWDRFASVVAPTAVTRGFVLAGVLGAWAIGFVGDTAAFRVGTTFEATLPALTMFGFAAALGTDRHRVAHAAFVLAAVLMFTLSRAWERRLLEAPWLRSDPRPGSGARSGSLSDRTVYSALGSARTGLALSAAATLVAALVGPLLPGARSAALVGWRAGPTSSATRITISPLVDIRARLLDQTEVEAFTVQADHPSYWRLTELDRFDGHLWSSLGTYRSTTRDLANPPPGNPGSAATTIHQRFGIEALSSIWLPAAFVPHRLSGPGHTRFDDDSASILTERASANGLHYSVDSVVPSPTPADLAGASANEVRTVDPRELGLPTDFPADVTALARAVTTPGSPSAEAVCRRFGCAPSERRKGPLTPYHQALALQTYLRNGFTYDVAGVPPGHDEDALRRFLFVTRRGYCEQFAGSYAAMARSIGLPARVAVGFTPGSPDAEGTFHVKGKDAHAWPEVYLGPAEGWVAFEPTPGRGLTSAEAYTGVAAPTPTPLQPSGGSAQQPAPTPRAPATPHPVTVPPPPAPTKAPIRHQRMSSWRALLVALIGLLLALGSAASAVPLAARWRRSRRRAMATTPEARVLLAWADAAESLARVGLVRARSETIAEYARRSGPRLTPGPTTALVDVTAISHAKDLEMLARAAGAAAYGAVPVGADLAESAERAARAVISNLRASMTRSERLRRAIDPRSLRR
ncbi:MAG: transglutaminase family protein [Acidimicrobiales bacterium]